MRWSCAGATIAPMSVDLSSGSPTRSFAIRAFSLAHEARRDALGDQQPRAGAAHLPLVEQDPVDHALDGAVEIGVVEHDERRLAAEFQAQPLARPGRRPADQPPDLGRAGEGDLVDASCADERRAGLAVAGDDVDDPGGSPASTQISAKASAVSGVYSAGFSTTVLPQASAGATFQASISSGKFQGMICPHTPTGRVAGELAVDQRGPAGVVVEVAGDERHVDVARLADRLAVVDRLQHGEEPLALLHRRARA